MRIPKAFGELDQSAIQSITFPRRSYCNCQHLHDEMSRIAELTALERRIIQLICDGMKVEQIANLLETSSSDVSGQIDSIFEKLRVEDCLELVIYAYLHALARVRDESLSESSQGMI